LIDSQPIFSITDIYYKFNNKIIINEILKIEFIIPINTIDHFDNTFMTKIKLLDKTSNLRKFYSKTLLTKKTLSKLLPYQVDKVVRMINILVQQGVCLNASDMGVGKTYMTAATCAELGRKPIVTCSKILMYEWKKVLDMFGVEYYDIVNYETLKNGKTYTNDNYKDRKECWYLKLIPENCDFIWNVPEDGIVIFDEAHICSNPESWVGKLLISSKKLADKKIPLILLSGTISEKLKQMRIPFYLFNIISNYSSYSQYIRSLSKKYPQLRVKRTDFDKKEDYKVALENNRAMMVHEEIKEFTVRIRKKDLGDKFPQNNWYAQEFVLDDYKEVCEAYEELNKLIDKIDSIGYNNFLAERIKRLQIIELKKVPIFVETANLFLMKGCSVIIMVNYTNTIQVLCDELDSHCIISGELQKDMNDRLECIRNFQENKEHVIICQIKAGGIGIGLHDIYGEQKGGRPRVCLLNYTDRATDLLQAMGRASRSESKSPVTQIIISVANVPEEHSMMLNVNKKLSNISTINDGDMFGYKHQTKKSRKPRLTKITNVNISENTNSIINN
jgi:hypothetical protein